MAEAICTNLKTHWKPVVFTTVLATTLIVLSIIKWGSVHFQGIGTIGSTALLTVGALSLFALLMIVSCKKGGLKAEAKAEDVPIQKVDSVKETPKGDLPVLDSIDVLNLDVVLLPNQYLHYRGAINNDERLLFGNSTGATSHAYEPHLLKDRLPVPQAVMDGYRQLPLYEVPTISSDAIGNFREALPDQTSYVAFDDPVNGRKYMVNFGFTENKNRLITAKFREMSFDILKLRHLNMTVSAKKS